jgi:hypothetical protein
VNERDNDLIAHYVWTGGMIGIEEKGHETEWQER